MPSFVPTTATRSRPIRSVRCRRAGGTWKKEGEHLIGLFAGFAFPQRIEAGTSRKTVDFGIWDLFVGVAFYTRPLF